MFVCARVCVFSELTTSRLTHEGSCHLKYLSSGAVRLSWGGRGFKQFERFSPGPEGK